MTNPVIQNASINWAIDVIELLRPGPGDIVVVKMSESATLAEYANVGHYLVEKRIRHVIVKGGFSVEFLLMSLVDLMRLRDQLDRVIKELNRDLPF